MSNNRGLILTVLHLCQHCEICNYIEGCSYQFRNSRYVYLRMHIIWIYMCGWVGIFIYRMYTVGPPYPQVPNRGYKGRLYHAISYKGPEHPWILVSLGILEPSPCEYRGIQTVYTACVCVYMYTHMFIYTHIPESVTMGISVGIAKHLPTPCVACCIYMIQSTGERSGRKGLSENQGGFLEKRLLCRPLREMEDRRQEWGQVQSGTESLTRWTEELVLWSHQTCYH